MKPAAAECRVWGCGVFDRQNRFYISVDLHSLESEVGRVGGF